MTPLVSVARGLCVLVLATSAFVPASAPQDAPRATGSPALQRFAEGLTVGDLLSTWTAETGRKFVVRDEGGLRQRRLTLTAPPQYAPADADYVYESMLLAAGLALTPAGPPDAKMFVVENVEQPAQLKQRARFVPRESLAALMRSPAQVFATAILLKNIKVDSVRNAVSQVLSNRNVEFTMDIPPANALYVIAFGPSLAALSDALAAIDVPGAPFQEKAKEKEKAQEKAQDKDKDDEKK